MLFQAASPADKVSGASIRAFVHALGLSQRRGLQALAEQGITSVDPDAWYPWQAYLNAQRTVYQTIGPNTVGRVGRKLVEEANFPLAIDSVHAALDTLNGDYRLRHRGRDVGGFVYQATGERSGRMTVRTPYPCELDRHVIEALCQRFRPADSLAVYLKHQEGCRNQGAEECVFHLHW